MSFIESLVWRVVSDLLADSMATDQLEVTKKPPMARRLSSKKLKQWRRSAPPVSPCRSVALCRLPLTGPPQQTRAVYDSVMASRLLLVEERDSSSEAKGVIQRHFTLLAADGAIHSVCISTTHSCSCPEFAGKKTLCHHIYFVLFKVSHSLPTNPRPRRPRLTDRVCRSSSCLRTHRASPRLRCRAKTWSRF